MKRNFGTAVRDVDGQPMKGPNEAPVTIGQAVILALTTDLREDDPAQKLARFKLALRLSGEGAENLELSVDEAKLIQDRAQKVCTTVVFGRIAEFLERDPPP